jgi:glycerol-3-phosphate acyltransferase PlsY
MTMTYGWMGLAITVAYLLGSIPTGYWLGRALKNIDIREVGSGSTGATNVLRTLGREAAIVVLAVDVAKGIGAVAIARWVGLSLGLPPIQQAWLMAIAGLMAVLGHSKSIFLQFTGGKSVATSIGVLLMLMPWVALGTLGSFLIILALFRMVSLGSIVGAIAVNLLAIGWGQPLPYCLFAGLAGIYVILRHRSNIERILAGTEPKIGQSLSEETSR